MQHSALTIGGLSLAVLLATGDSCMAADPEREAARAMLERTQQSEALSLQLRQSQDLLRAPDADRLRLERLYRDQRFRQEALQQQQVLQQSSQAGPPSASDSNKFERERRAASLQPNAGDATRSWGPRLNP